MITYKIELKDRILRVNFSESAQNDQIVKDAVAWLQKIAASSELLGE